MPISRFSLAAAADINRIVAGEALTITVELYDSITQSSYGVSGCTGASGVFPGASGQVIKTLGAGVTTDSSNPNRLKVALTSAETLALNQASEQSWEVHVAQPDGTLRIAQLCQVLDVVAALA